MIEIKELIEHPEQLDRETLYELRSMLALHPYFQTARLLMLHNLYLLHDPTFDEELRRAAVYITDRRKVFQLIEAAHYNIPATAARTRKEPEKPAEEDANRTISLIDNFLDTIPKEEEKDGEGKKRRRPTNADATVDYVAYLLESETYPHDDDDVEQQPQLKGHDLINDFIENERGRIVLNEIPEFTPQQDNMDDKDGESAESNYFTETLARIYIKQHRYDKALEIIRQLSLNYPKKNAYFADQIRFLEKLIINNNKK